jgi:hypothetical protein
VCVCVCVCVCVIVGVIVSVRVLAKRCEAFPANDAIQYRCPSFPLSSVFRETDEKRGKERKEERRRKTE